MPKKSKKNPLIFISYSHDSSDHSKKVLTFSERLRADGFETVLDQYVNGTPTEGWPRWMPNQLERATHVLVICTKHYYQKFRGNGARRKGRGVDWEGAIITQELYDQKSRTVKFVPVLFPLEKETSIPGPLRSHTHYRLDSSANYEKLKNFLLGKAGVQPRPVGSAPDKARTTGEVMIFPDEQQPPSSSNPGIEEPKITPPPNDPQPHKEKKTKSSDFAHLTAILIGDIENFSKLDVPQQKELIEKINEFLDNLTETLKPVHRFPLLDGFGLIWEGVLSHKKALNVATEALEKLRDSDQKPVLRIGLHDGHYAVYAQTRPRGKHFWGSGLNDAARLTGLGDAGSLLMTDTYFLKALKNGVQDLVSRVEPKGEEGYEVYMGRGDGGRVRRYIDPCCTNHKPHRLLHWEMARAELDVVMVEIAIYFSETLAKMGLDPNRTNVRSTLWVPDPMRPGNLRATPHRVTVKIVNDEWEAEVETDLSQTNYSYENEGEGPPGMAWKAEGENAVVAYGLPDYDKDPQGYRNALSKFNLDGNKVKSMGKGYGKARIIAAYAFPKKQDGAGKILGVVCLDSLDTFPEEKFASSVMQGIISELVEPYSRSLTLALISRG